MRSPAFALLPTVVALLSGCANRPDNQYHQPPLTQYTADDVDWSSLQRVLVLPLANESEYPDVAAELQTALAAELQRAGRLEVTVVPPDNNELASWAQEVFDGGQFDEVRALKIARQYGVEGLVFGVVTQYHPYLPPRVGFSAVIVSPAQAVVVASVDGLWDAREYSVAESAKSYYRQNLEWPESIIEDELALTSPNIFQRFVAREVAVSLSGIPVARYAQAGRRERERTNR